MKITVKKELDSKVITIPNALLFHPASGWLMRTAGRKYLPEELKTLDIRPILSELRRIQKRYGSWTLVEVQTADGEEVTVTI